MKEQNNAAAKRSFKMPHAYVIIVLLLATNRTVSGKSYLYPLIPFNGAALKRLLVRCRMSNKNS